MKKIKLKPVFVHTTNVRDFEVMMDGLALSAGEGRLGIVYGQAGRGKTRTSQWYQANNDCIYLRMATVWRTSELYFMQVLCRELGIVNPPGRKGPAFATLVDQMIENPRPVFLDEIEKMPKFFLDLVRDLSDLSTAPIILIGEMELYSFMKQNRRVWSRTFQRLEFKPIETKDIIIFAKRTADLNLKPQVANIFFRASKGDFRIVKRDIINLVQIVNSKGTDTVTEEMAKIACKTGLVG